MGQDDQHVPHAAAHLLDRVGEAAEEMSSFTNQTSVTKSVWNEMKLAIPAIEFDQTFGKLGQSCFQSSKKGLS